MILDADSHINILTINFVKLCCCLLFWLGKMLWGYGHEDVKHC